MCGDTRLIDFTNVCFKCNLLFRSLKIFSPLYFYQIPECIVLFHFKNKHIAVLNIVALHIKVIISIHVEKKLIHSASS